MYLAIFDIDKFKYVNDTFGHLAGDAVLQYFAKKLSGLVRKSDLVGRYGGDEFLCLFYNADTEALAKRLETFAGDLKNNPVTISGTQFVCTFCVGISSFGEDGTEFSDLFNAADIRMYTASRIAGQPATESPEKARNNTQAAGFYRRLPDIANDFVQ